MRRIIYILANVILSAIIFASCSGVDEENTVNGFEYVDLGLPSGTKWAASNNGPQVILEQKFQSRQVHILPGEKYQKAIIRKPNVRLAIYLFLI